VEAQTCMHAAILTYKLDVKSSSRELKTLKTRFMKRNLKR